MQSNVIQFVGPEHNLQIFGVKLLGLDAHNGHKLLFSLVFLAVLVGMSKSIRFAARSTPALTKNRAAFWTRQGISLATFIVAAMGLMSIWFDNPARLTTGIGLVSAGLAFALQKVITSFAGYFVILRGNTFNVGDRIVMGSVRGDVIALNFIQTVIMEMGEPPSTQTEDPGMWVMSRQYSGRIVTVSNSVIFDEPVYNFTREFPYIWEEIHLPVSYKDDRVTAEKILLAAAERETSPIANLAEPALKALQEQFRVRSATELNPRVYMRLTDNWVELTVRFLCKDHDIRGLRDRISRDIIDNLDKAGIGIASGTYEITGLPPIRVDMRTDNVAGQA